MRLRLIIMRHAEAVAESGNSQQADHSRPLSIAGRADAQSIAKKLKEAGWEPTLIVASDSARTVETAKMMRFPKPPTEVYLPSLYLAGVASIQKELTFSRVLPHKTIMVLGHNPGWSMAIEALTGKPISLKTAEAALLEMEADNWNEALMMEESWTLCKVLSAKVEAAAFHQQRGP